MRAADPASLAGTAGEEAAAGGGGEGLKITKAMIKVIYNCLNAYCVPGTVLNVLQGSAHLRPHNNSMHYMLLY